MPRDDLVPDLVRFSQAGPGLALADVDQRDAFPVQQGPENPLSAGGLRAAMSAGSQEMSMISVIPAVVATALRGVGMIPVTPALRRALLVSARICRRASSSARLLSSARSLLEILHELQDLLLLLRGHLA